MAGKNLFPLAGGVGITAGAPFTPFHYTIVTTAGPPTIANGRLEQLADAMQSVLAPGVSANTLVLGEGARDFAGADRSILLGYQVVGSNGGAAQQTDNILIGERITIPAAATATQNLIMLGGTPTFGIPGLFNGYGGSIYLGFNQIINNTLVTAALNNVMLGDSATVTGGANVVIGVGASCTSDEATAIGELSRAGSLACAFGRIAVASGVGAVSLGRDSEASSVAALALGRQAKARADYALAVGLQCEVYGTGSIGLGFGLNVPIGLPNTFVCGSRSQPIVDVYFGASFNDATGGVTYSWNYTNIYGGAGNNLEGNTLVIAGGNGTGNWANAQNRGIDLRCGLLAAGGSTQQPSTSVLALRHSDLNVALWGGLGATFGGGAKVLFFGDATTAPTTNPTAGGLLYSVASQLKWRDSAGVVTNLTPASGGATAVNLAGDVTTTSLAFTNVTGLTFAAAIGTYYLTGVIKVAAGATDAMQIALNGPALTSLLTVILGYDSTAGSVAGLAVTAYDGSFGTAIGGSTYHAYAFTAFLVVSAAGTVALRFRNASGAGTDTVTVRAGSTLTYQKVA